MSIATQQRLKHLHKGAASFVTDCRQPTTCPETLMRHAELSQSRLLIFARALAEELDLSPETQVVKGPMKERARIESKAQGKYDGHYDQVFDYGRDRILFTNPEQILEFRKMTGPGKISDPFLATWRDRGIEIVEVDDAFLSRKKSGMVGVNISVKIDLGKGRYHICEIQMMHEDMQNIDRLTHQNYEENIRPITDVAFADGDRDLTEDEAMSIYSAREANWNMYDSGIVRCKLQCLLSPDGMEELEARLSQNVGRHRTTRRNSHLHLVAA
jgi:hypothetical protein